MNDTPQGDGNEYNLTFKLYPFTSITIRMNDTPQGDGNYKTEKLNLYQLL